jgi:hypothetical protein
VNNALTGHYWKLEKDHGFGVVCSAGKGMDLQLDSEVTG